MLISSVCSPSSNYLQVYANCLQSFLQLSIILPPTVCGLMPTVCSSSSNCLQSKIEPLHTNRHAQSDSRWRAETLCAIVSAARRRRASFLADSRPSSCRSSLQRAIRGRTSVGFMYHESSGRQGFIPTICGLTPTVCSLTPTVDNRRRRETLSWVA
jgi:hypothetical protein